MRAFLQRHAKLTKVDRINHRISEIVVNKNESS